MDVCIHLAQIFYNPAYYDSPIDYLAEPGPVRDQAQALGQIRRVQEIEGLLVSSKSRYIQHIQQKLLNIARWSKDHGGDILVFPEYSVPLEALPQLMEHARTSGQILVAGTHRVQNFQQAMVIYTQLGIDENLLAESCAVAPILFPDGHIELVFKHGRSKWESNLPTMNTPSSTFTLTKGKQEVRFAVAICIDGLFPKVLSDCLSQEQIHLVICPALSPSTSPFDPTAALLSQHETLFAYCNTACHGGTSFNLPEAWNPYLSGTQLTSSVAAANSEALLELSVDPSALFQKRGSVIASPICSRPILYPCAYPQSSTTERRV